MDTYIDSRFERLEAALAGLIDSVAKYHPSVTKADELRAADAALAQGLEQVQAHQRNLLRIRRLRAASAALDAQVRDTLASLAATRRAIVTTHATVFPREPSYPLAYEELLSYARRISKTTLPHAATISAAAAADAAAAAEGPSPSPVEGQTPAAAARAMTPSAPTPSQAQSPVANGPPSQLPAAAAAAANLNTSLPEGMSQYLNPLSGQLFFPWPLEDKIRSGSLASYQMLVEQGIDPKGYDPATEEERRRREDDERRAREDREDREREDRERRAREERERLRVERERQREKEQLEWRRASIAGHPPGPSAAPRASVAAPADKKQFQFSGLDDLDDDDDEDDDDDDQD